MRDILALNSYRFFFLIQIADLSIKLLVNSWVLQLKLTTLACFGMEMWTILADTPHILIIITPITTEFIEPIVFWLKQKYSENGPRRKSPI